MKRMEYIIGLDLGTSATKTVLFDRELRIVASASREYPLSQPRNGWAEQNPEDWRNAALETIREVLGRSGVSGDPSRHHLVRSANRSGM